MPLRFIKDSDVVSYLLRKAREAPPWDFPSLLTSQKSIRAIQQLKRSRLYQGKDIACSNSEQCYASWPGPGLVDTEFMQPAFRVARG